MLVISVELNRKLKKKNAVNITVSNFFNVSRLPNY